MRCRLAASEKKAKTSSLGSGSFVDTFRTCTFTLRFIQETRTR